MIFFRCRSAAGFGDVYRRCLAIGLGLLVGVCQAQSLSVNAPQNGAGFPEKPWQRDPFSPSRTMYDAIGQQSGATAGVYGFVPNVEGMKVPRMTLRGLMNGKDGEFLALLEIAGIGTYMVREGDEFNIDPSQPRNALRISKITRLSVTVQTGMLGSIRVMR